MVLCDVNQCVGCGACAQRCPTNSIAMVQNHEGFAYPQIDGDTCTDCGLCIKSCFQMNDSLQYHDKGTVYACILKNREDLERSSSGGAFYGIAQHVIAQNGVVFGATYRENMTVGHIGVTEIEKLSKLQGSKYVQSDIGDIYKQAQKQLKAGKLVLFTGTGCQIAGLYSFLGREYPNLITCDLLCKGVTSPGVFRQYIRAMENKYKKKVIGYNFRCKKYGWILGGKIEFSDGTSRYLKGEDAAIMRSVGKAYIRNACFECLFTRPERVSDFSIGDFWHIGENEHFDRDTEKGVSVMLCNTDKASALVPELEEYLWIDKRTFDEVIRGQGSALSRPLSCPKSREAYFAAFDTLSYHQVADRFLIDHSMRGWLDRNTPMKIQQILRRIKRKCR